MDLNLSSNFVSFNLSEDEEMAAYCSSPFLLPALKAKLAVYSESAMQQILASDSQATDTARREAFLVTSAKVAVLRELCDEVARAQAAQSDRQSQTARSSTPD